MKQSDVFEDYPEPEEIDKKRNTFFARGHLTPKSDFRSPEGRDLTMINTNIAPQWQEFNAKNWAVLENAVRSYAANKKKTVYVFTGTGNVRSIQNLYIHVDFTIPENFYLYNIIAT